jgi:hypothetical protein
MAPVLLLLLLLLLEMLLLGAGALLLAAGCMQLLRSHTSDGSTVAVTAAGLWL